MSARALTCAGLMVGLLLALIGISHPLAFFGPCLFIGIGNGLTLPAANMGAMSVRNDLAGTAVGLAAAMSIGGSALVVSVAGLFLRNTGSVIALLGAMFFAASLAMLAALLAAELDRIRNATRWQETGYITVSSSSV